MVSGRFWELLGTPGVDSSCLGVVLAASRAIVPTHRTAVRPTELLLWRKGSIILGLMHSRASLGASGGLQELLKRFREHLESSLGMVPASSGAIVATHQAAVQPTQLLLWRRGSIILGFTHSRASLGASGGLWELLKRFGSTWIGSGYLQSYCPGA